MMSHIVMLVDDDPAVLSGLSRALNNEPYTVISAGSAEDALRALRVQPVDVVVSDEEMPGMRAADVGLPSHSASAVFGSSRYRAPPVEPT